MPELPEVETVKRILEPQLAGRRITEVTVRRKDVIARPDAEAFARQVAGAAVTGMGRRGKFLTICLGERGTLVLHLRMTGQLLVTPGDFPVEKHTHLLFQLDNGTQLRFIDTRRFGRFWLIGEGEENCFSGVGKLGPEPFDQALSADYLRERLGKSRRAIKECLLDQSVVAGIGNIYGDEILFAAGLHPGRQAASLSEAEWLALSRAVPRIMSEGIRNDRMTAGEYLAGGGKEYRNGKFWKVYGREGEPCPRCGAALERLTLSGRGSCFCPCCQRRGS